LKKSNYSPARDVPRLVRGIQRTPVHHGPRGQAAGRRGTGGTWAVTKKMCYLQSIDVLCYLL